MPCSSGYAHTGAADADGWHTGRWNADGWHTGRWNADGWHTGCWYTRGSRDTCSRKRYAGSHGDWYARSHGDWYTRGDGDRYARGNDPDAIAHAVGHFETENRATILEASPHGNAELIHVIESGLTYRAAGPWENTATKRPPNCGGSTLRSGFWGQQRQ